jgi:hypothetical protein
MVSLRRASPVAVGVVACLLLGASIVRLGSVPAIVAPTVLGLMALVVLVHGLIRWSDDPEATVHIGRWTMASFVVHLVVGVALTGSAVAAKYFGGDAFTYHDGAVGIVAHWQHGAPLPSLHGGKEGYYYLLGGLYWVFGAHKFAGVALNAALAAALIPIIADSTHRLFGPRSARYVAPITVLVPGMVVWTSQLLKEAPILFLLALAANCGVRLVHKVTWGPLLVLMATLPALLSFRGPIGLAALGGIVAGVALGKREVAGGVVTAMGVVAVVTIGLALGLGSSGYSTTVQTDLKTANLTRQDLAASGKSGFGHSADISTTQGAISYLPRGIAGFALGPFPWEISGTRQLIAVPDLIAWYILIPALWRGSRAASRRTGRRPLVLALPALAITIMVALVVGNYGTIVRERMQILVLMAPVIALGFAIVRPEKSQEPESVPALVG